MDLLLIENKAVGISVAQEIRRLYSNEKFGVQLFDPKSQDKLSRLYSVRICSAEEKNSSCTRLTDLGQIVVISQVASIRRPFGQAG